MRVFETDTRGGGGGGTYTTGWEPLARVTVQLKGMKTSDNIILRSVCRSPSGCPFYRESKPHVSLRTQWNMGVTHAIEPEPLQMSPFLTNDPPTVR